MGGEQLLLAELDGGDRLYRYKKAAVLLFHGKRTVLSTGPNNGGYREDLTAVFNHDMNPGSGMACEMRADTYEEHMNIVAREDLGLDPAHCTGLSTAACMENLVIRQLHFEDLTVTAAVTGGIERNAGRIGDPATFAERTGEYYTLRPGTINILLHLSCALDPGTLVRCMVTATEAKTAAIQELLAPSCYSDGIATGSGTDGTIIVSNPSSALKLTNAGKNSKLGELIGRTVKEALKEALYRQSGLCPKSQHDILRRMGRFGVTEDALWCEYSTRQTEQMQLNRAEFTVRLDRVRSDPALVTGASLYAHILDQLKWRLLDANEAEAAGAKILADWHAARQEYGTRTESFVKDAQKTFENLKKQYIQALIDVILQ